MKKLKHIGISIIIILSFLAVYGFFMIPLEKEFIAYEVVECERSDTLSFLASIESNKITFKNGDLTLPEIEYLEQISYCSYGAIDKDLVYLKDSLGFGEAVEQSYFDLLTKNQLDRTPIDTINLKPEEMMNALLLGERALLYPNSSDENIFFYKAIGRFWLNTVSNKLNILSKLDPSIKYDENFKILTDRCSQNKYHVELRYTYGDKFINYLVEKKYAYIANRIWIGTPPIFKLFLILIAIITLYAYFLFTQKIITLVKNKLQ